MLNCTLSKLLLGWVIILASSCSNRVNDLPKLSENKASRPSIYDAWEARYDYDPNSREMVPIFEGRVVGKTWARGADGQLSSSLYTGRSNELDEDLFPLHLSKLDSEREKIWDENKQKRIEHITEMLNNIEEEKKEPLVEVLIEEEEEFIPPVFIPSGIDIENNEEKPPLNPVSPEGNGEGELSPFLPLP